MPVVPFHRKPPKPTVEEAAPVNEPVSERGDRILVDDPQAVEPKNEDDGNHDAAA